MLVVFVSASASSIALFEHICKKEGVNTSLFVPTASHQHALHTDHHQTTESVESCCHSNKENGIDEDCCDTDVKILKVEQQYYSEIQKFIHPYLHYINPFTQLLFLSSDKKGIGKQFYRPPPVLPTTKRLAFLQTYLI